MQKDIKDLKVLFSNKEIIEKIKQQAQILNSIYDNNKTLIMICILKGAVMFYSELVKHLKMPVQMEFISLSSYGSYTKSTGEIKTINLTLPDLKDKNVLIVEDIIDTGLTLEFLTKYIKKNCEVKDLKLINTLFELGDYEIWLDANFNNKIVESWFDAKKGKKSRSILLARDMI